MGVMLKINGTILAKYEDSWGFKHHEELQ